MFWNIWVISKHFTLDVAVRAAKKAKLTLSFANRFEYSMFCFLVEGTLERQIGTCKQQLKLKADLIVNEWNTPSGFWKLCRKHFSYLCSLRGSQDKASEAPQTWWLLQEIQSFLLCAQSSRVTLTLCALLWCFFCVCVFGNCRSDGLHLLPN